MLNENAKKWVAALRSGKYKQAVQALTTLDEKGEISGCCCLGVACELAIENGVVLVVFRDPQKNIRVYNGERGLLPTSVMEWLGLRDAGGQFNETPDGDYQLSASNDRGATFERIAQIIESEPKNLFL